MRLYKLDLLKSIAIFTMILFHTNYILKEVFFIDILNFSDNFWFYLWKVWWFLFIFLSWISFFLASNKYKENIYKKYFKIILKLLAFSIIITTFTYFFIPSQVIWFWILHFFSLSFLFMLLIHWLWYYNLIIWILIFIIYLYFPIYLENNYLAFFGIHSLWFFSADYYPLIPYFSYFLFWFIFWKYLNDKWLLKYLQLKETKFTKIINFTSKNSLNIYIIHTPIIYLIIYISLKIFNN